MRTPAAFTYGSNSTYFVRRSAHQAVQAQSVHALNDLYQNSVQDELAARTLERGSCYELQL